MKKQIIVALCIALCSLMIASIGTASAFKTGFTHISYSAVNPTVVDGKWTTTDEWSDCQQTMVGPTPPMSLFRDKWTMEMAGESFAINQFMLIENLADTTTDAGDYAEVCIDSLMDGGTAPKVDDYKIVLTPTTATWYKGTGTTWAAMATPASFKWNTSVATSFSSGPAHRIYELQFEKMALSIGGTTGYLWYRIATFDASNPSAGIAAWPTATSANSANVPDDWGYMDWSQDPVPEGFNFGILVMLSSVAVVAGAICIRKMAVPKFGKLSTK